MRAKNERRTAAAPRPSMTPMGGNFRPRLSPSSICSLTLLTAEGIAGSAVEGGGGAPGASVAGGTNAGLTPEGAVKGTSSTTGPAGAAPGWTPLSGACIKGVLAEFLPADDRIG